MASQRSNQPNYDIHVHPSMRSALKAYMDTTRVPASTFQSKNGACVPHPRPALSAPADMLSGLLLEDAVLHNATKKIHNPYDKMFFLGTLAALHLIIMFGGELFTGNTMILSIGVYNKVVPLRLLITNWIIIYIGNWCGCLITAYFFGYLTDLFESEPYRSFLTSVTLSKLEEHGWGVLFLKAIPANAMVCMAVMLGLASRHSAGKIMALWFPVVMFVLCGFGHCVANMFFTSLGLMYGAPSTIRR
ncbi:unnamed protein product [Rhizoctonia solani]|uniref:Formate/nitrite transporter n=1 Tax=Rhizoctonia solani TaxID=456999 RepID=A0A8H2X9P4_9AGAM|nr:unnamed protein product [Rhizoctonia solani]